MLKRIAALFVAFALAATGMASPAQASGDVTWTAKPSPVVGGDDKDLPDPGQRRALSAAAVPPSPMTIRWYSGGYQYATNEGINIGMKARDNYFDTAGDYHNITQISVQDTATGNAVELGYGKGGIGCNSGVWGQMCVFAGVRVGGTWQGYNVGEVDWASNFNLGDALFTETAGCTSTTSPARNERFGIRKNTTSLGWMLWVDVCYGDTTAGVFFAEFPASLWPGGFASSDLVQMFNETATPYNPANPGEDGYSCSDQGGSLATTTSGTGMRFADATISGLANTAVNLTPFAQTTGGYYDADLPGRYAAAVLAGQPAGNVRYINAGGLGTNPAGTADGGLNCT